MIGVYVLLALFLLSYLSSILFGSSIFSMFLSSDQYHYLAVSALHGVIVDICLQLRVYGLFFFP